MILVPLISIKCVLFCSIQLFLTLGAILFRETSTLRIDTYLSWDLALETLIIMVYWHLLNSIVLISGYNTGISGDCSGLPIDAPAAACIRMILKFISTVCTALQNLSTLLSVHCIILFIHFIFRIKFRHWKSTVVTRFFHW